MSDQQDNQNNPYDLATIDQEILTHVVRQSMLNADIVVTDWQVERVHGGAGDVGSVISAIYRFKGTAHYQDIENDWSVILKVIGTTATHADPSETRYWKREMLAYQSGQLAKLEGGLNAPRFFGTHTFSEQIVGLWLEDMVDEVGSKWSLEIYGEVAYQLGLFNGTYLNQHDLPDWNWLAPDWLRVSVDRSRDDFKKIVNDPQLLGWYKTGDPQRMLQLLYDRHLFLDALNRLPQTLLHRDAFRRNLFIQYDANKKPHLVAVDWTYISRGAIGEEIVSTVFGSLFFSEVAMTDAKQLDAICFDEYLRGLRDTGWDGDPNLVRLGYAAGSIAFSIGYGLLRVPPEDAYPWLEQAFGLPIADFKHLGAEIRHFLLDLADEARRLIHSLDTK